MHLTSAESTMPLRDTPSQRIFEVFPGYRTAEGEGESSSSASANTPAAPRVPDSEPLELVAQSRTRRERLMSSAIEKCTGLRSRKVHHLRRCRGSSRALGGRQRGFCGLEFSRA